MPFKTEHVCIFQPHLSLDVSVTCVAFSGLTYQWRVEINS